MIARRWLHAAIALAFALLAGLAPAQEHARGRLLVQPFADATPAEVAEAIAPYGRRGRAVPGTEYFILVLPANANEAAVAAQLAKHPRIRAVQVDRRRPLSLTPNDPNLGSGWHLATLGAPAAWDLATGAGVVMAVCDSGVDAAHPDLALVPGWNSFDNNANTADVYGHGTKVAGAIAMAGNNGVGGAGVAWRTRIWPGRVTDTNGWGYDSAIADCITRAANAGARGANVSFGGVCSSPIVISAAQYMRSKGGVVTASSGNSGGLDSAPASDAITCVGATGPGDTRAGWSTYGPGVDLVAPGENIFTTTNGGGYGGASGTSFSAPVALGVYALMMAMNPTLSPLFLDRILAETARDLGPAGRDNEYGAGRIDAAAAVAHAASLVETPDTTPPTVTIASPADGATLGGVVAVQVRAADNRAVTKLELLINGRIVAVGEGTSLTHSWNTCPPGPANVRRACGGLSAIGARATDAAGNVARTAINVNVNR